MLLHYIKIAVRQLLKYKLHTAVSLLCMSLGLVLFGFVDSYPLFELDKELTRIIDFMPQKDGNTYMLQGEEIVNDRNHSAAADSAYLWTVQLCR